MLPSYEDKVAVAILLLMVVGPRSSGDMFVINLDRGKGTSALETQLSV
jgi:hypothetical protein